MVAVFLLQFITGNLVAQQNNAAVENNFKTVKNKNGPVLGYSPASGVKIITVGGLNFKDLNKNGQLDKYEDWRLDVNVRAKDLAAKMTKEQIAGLMLYSGHQAIPASAQGFGAATYGGKPFPESGANNFCILAIDILLHKERFCEV